MGLIQTIIFKYTQKRELRNDTCDSFIQQIDIALQEVRDLFFEQQAFINPIRETEWRSHYSLLITNINQINIQTLKKARNFKKLLERQRAFNQTINSLKVQISNHNNMVADKKIENAYAIIGNIEGNKLDRQQMACIVKDVPNQLVIAGAGTGKTTTIIGKIKFLLKSEKYNSEDILVLSFTSASASEIGQRINKETGCNIDAYTFHKLGLNIIKKVEGSVPKITQVNLSNFIKEQLLINMQSDTYLHFLTLYVLYNRGAFKSEFLFDTQNEYDEYLRLNPPTTMKRETVKSYGELDIANFLYQNGVQYIYEYPYEIDTSTSEYRRYVPDFYLPEYKVYIEYFGINKNGEVPSYFKGRGGMTATQTYQESMNWKRGVHKMNNTSLIECYAYEKMEGVLLENLKKKLIENSVKLVPKTAKELWTQISNDNNFIIDSIGELFETIINLMKSNNYTINAVRQLNANNNNFQSNNIVLSLVEPIYDAYNSYLSNHKEIDFNDMINMARQYIEQKKYINPYKYIIIDEYQDISKARFLLLDALRKSNTFDLFCVGDDWQSIYRFAGSDIGLILNFERYWGATEISKIETTYRFNQKLIEISSNFIMQNPIQIKKYIKGKRNSIGSSLGEICGYTEKFAIEFMTKKFNDLPKSSSVFLIGRYSFDVNLLSENKQLSCKYNNVSGLIEVKYHNRPDLNINFITAHKSKGLQADYIFIINNKRSKMGFPSMIQDAPIFDLLLDNYEQYPFAEERRLFYVALTRAKKKAYIVTVNNKESEFVIELKKHYSDELKKEKFECPLCGGRLQKKKGPYGEFFGCSNYRNNGCTYKRQISSH